MTMMNLALLPDWNSLDSVRRAHSDLEAAGIVFFALLVMMEALAHNSTNEKRKHLFDSIGIWFFAVAIICEIVGYRYSQRNDDLSARVIGSLDSEATNASTAAGIAIQSLVIVGQEAGIAQTKAKRATTEAESVERDMLSAKQKVGDLQIRLTDALERTKRLEAQLSWRTVTPEQKKAFRDALLKQMNSLPSSGLKIKKYLPLLGLKIRFTYPNGNAEAEEYAEELKDAMDGLGAEISEPSGMETFVLPGSPVFQGATISVNPATALTSEAKLLLENLNAVGIAIRGEIQPHMADREVAIDIGIKPHKTQP